MTSNPAEPMTEAEPAAGTCSTCEHPAALHKPMGMCWQPVIRSPRDRKAKFCGCLTEEAAKQVAALRTTTSEES